MAQVKARRGIDSANKEIDDGTRDYIPLRKQQQHGKTPKKHITEYPITWTNWYKHVNWLSSTFVLSLPLLGCIGACYVPLRLYTAVFAVVYYFHTGLGITAGYHRLWAHTSYRASLPLKIYLASVGSGAIQGSIRWWSTKHRSHHRYTDTSRDPYSVSKGLLYSHLGWIIMKQHPLRVGRTDISDLNADPVVVFQHMHYLKCVLFMALLFPALVCGIGWGDWWGGLVYAGLLRGFVVQQATFCVNSLAHWLGEQPFDDRNSPRDSMVTALLTLGEGYHNFHHEFPSDYRNTVAWWQYDPTKWCIWTWKQLGLAAGLKEFRRNEIEKGRVQQLQKRLDRERERLDWGIPLHELPVVEWDEFVDEARGGGVSVGRGVENEAGSGGGQRGGRGERGGEKEGRKLVAVAGVIHDVTDFINDHPGGKALIGSAVGKDATAIFNGGVYNHSNAAHNLLATMRVGVLRGGCEVEIWKQARSQDKDLML